jgi:hypothetical protein
MEFLQKLPPRNSETLSPCRPIWAKDRLNLVKTPILIMYRGKLPHWRMDGSTYFVTWRLAVSQCLLESKERTLASVMGIILVPLDE